LPKRGFVSRMRNDTAQVRLSALAKLPVGEIDISSLKAAGLIPAIARTAKVILAGKIDKPVQLKGVLATKGAKAAIEAAGGTVA